MNRATRRRQRVTASQPSAFDQVLATASAGPLAFGMPHVQLPPVEGKIRPRGPQPAAAPGLAPAAGPAIPPMPGARYVRLDLVDGVSAFPGRSVPALDAEATVPVDEVPAHGSSQTTAVDDTAEYVLRDVHQSEPDAPLLRRYAPQPEPPTAPSRRGLPGLLDELHAVDAEIYAVPLGTAPVHEAALAHVEWSPDEEAAIERAKRMLLDGADAGRVAAALEAFVAQQNLLAGAR